MNRKNEQERKKRRLIKTEIVRMKENKRQIVQEKNSDFLRKRQKEKTALKRNKKKERHLKKETE